MELPLNTLIYGNREAEKHAKIFFVPAKNASWTSSLCGGFLRCGWRPLYLTAGFLHKAMDILVRKT
jgi:hypothetical protein